MFLFTAYRRFITLILFVCLSSLSFSQSQPTSTQRDTLRELAEEEQKRTMDPALGRVPYERLEEARQQLVVRESAQTQSAIPNVTWQERGPSNAGGRTRTLLFDLNDSAHKKVWAGSVAGGLWYTPDVTDPNVGWTPVSDAWENTIVTALAADPANPQIMYAGTGDTYDYRPGGGIWKTTNGGTTWTRLSSTIPGGSPPAINRAFDFIQRIVVNSSGQVFVATQYGVVRSTDGGNTWGYALAPGQLIGVGGTPASVYNDKVTDLEIGSDGILYAAFYPSRVFRSNDGTGTAWTEITPPGASGGERTELALAPSTSGAGQVVYGVSRAYNATNYNQDVRWFKKSTNGGATWSDMTIPATGSGSTAHFTNGNGYYAMSLVAHPTEPNTLYAGGNNWYRSLDGGSTWSSPLLTPSYSPYQHSVLFQPGGITVVALSSDIGVLFSADWGSSALALPTVANRNNGYRASEVSSVAMKASPGNTYLLSTARHATFKLTTGGLSTGSVIFLYNFDQGATFIDEDNPAQQLFVTSGGSHYLYDGTSILRYLFNSNTGYNAADYDSPSNILYTSDYLNGTYHIRRSSGMGSSSITTTNLLFGASQPSFLKLNSDRTALFVGTFSGKLYKVTNLNQATPTVTAIDNNAFPQYTTVSSVDLGATDQELLVTLSNFGVQSVWYSSDGGATWTGKDQSNYGLPDMPVRYALFNPQNRKQVLLATELGIWSTNDITSPNPGWTPTGTGMGTYRVNQLRYRASDGLVTAATGGRGIWTTDAFAVPYTLPTVAITGVSNATLCAGNTFTVSFAKSGPAMGGSNKYEVWLSDANGNFTNMQRVGSGADSPVTATLPGNSNALPYGTNYRVKIIATDPEVESGISDALAIGNLTSVYPTDRTGGSPTVFPNSPVTLIVVAQDNRGNPTLPERYQWGFNGSNIPGATGATYTATNPGSYSVSVTQAGCVRSSFNYTLYQSTSITPRVNYDVALICQGQFAKLRAAYAGDNAVFQWMRNGADISGATSFSLAATETGLYTYRLRDGAYSITSSAQYIQVGQALPVSIRLNSPSDSVRCASYSGSTSMFANTSSSLYSYQWKANGVPIPGATSAFYSAFGTGAYNVTVKQGTCETNSNVLTIRASASALPVTITYTGSTSLCSGESRSLFASPVAGVTYQWQKDGVDMPGATSSVLTVNSTGSYTVRLTQAGSCTGISNAVRFQFGNVLSFKIGPSYDPGTCGGYSLASQEYNNNLPGYTYQWQKDGVDLSGATFSSHFTGSSGLYSLRISNGSCSGTSKPFYAKIGQLAKPDVLTEAPFQRCAGGSVRLTTSVYTGAFQWKRNGVAIPFAQTSTYYATESGQYSLVSTQGPCQAESDPVEVNIGDPTTAQLSGNALISSGQSAQLPVVFTGTAPWSFTLNNGQTVQSTYQNPYVLTVSPTTTTTYALAAVATGCGTGSALGNATVTVSNGSADVALSMAVSNRTPKINDVVDVALTLTNAGPQEAVGIQTKSLLPAGLVFVEGGSPGVSFADGVVNASVGTLAVNGGATVSFKAKATQAGTFVTAAQITGSQTPDPDSQPNSGTGDGQDDAAQVDLRAADSPGPLLVSANPNQVPLPRLIGNQPVADPTTADLSLTMSVDKPVVNPVAKDISIATLTISNRGGTTANSVAVQVSLPTGYFDYQNQPGWVKVDDQTYRGYIDQVPAGGSAKLTLRWQPSGNEELKAQILDVAEMDPDSTPGNGYTNGEDDEAALKVRVR